MHIVQAPQRAQGAVPTESWQNKRVQEMTDQEVLAMALSEAEADHSGNDASRAGVPAKRHTKAKSPSHIKGSTQLDTADSIPTSAQQLRRISPPQAWAMMQQQLHPNNLSQGTRYMLVCVEC